MKCTVITILYIKFSNCYQYYFQIYQKFNLPWHLIELCSKNVLYKYFRTHSHCNIFTFTVYQWPIITYTYLYWHLYIFSWPHTNAIYMFFLLSLTALLPFYLSTHTGPPLFYLKTPLVIEKIDINITDETKD